MEAQYCPYCARLYTSLDRESGCCVRGCGAPISHAQVPRPDAVGWSHARANEMLSITNPVTWSSGGYGVGQPVTISLPAIRYLAALILG